MKWINEADFRKFSHSKISGYIYDIFVVMLLNQRGAYRDMYCQELMSKLCSHYLI